MKFALCFVLTVEIQIADVVASVLFIDVGSTLFFFLCCVNVPLLSSGGKAAIKSAAGAGLPGCFPLRDPVGC